MTHPMDERYRAFYEREISMNDTAKKKVILIVDDQPRMLRFMEIELRLSGFDVLTTTSGREALEMVRSGGPDLMILDILMPEIDGYTLIRERAGSSRGRAIAVAAIFSNPPRARDLGATPSSSRPFRAKGIVPKKTARTGGCLPASGRCGGRRPRRVLISRRADTLPTW